METDIILKIAENYGVIPLLIFVIVKLHFLGKRVDEIRQDVVALRNKDCTSSCSNVVPLAKGVRNE